MLLLLSSLLSVLVIACHCTVIRKVMQITPIYENLEVKLNFICVYIDN